MTSAAEEGEGEVNEPTRLTASDISHASKVASISISTAIHCF